MCDEGGVGAVEKGPVDDVQQEGDVLQLQHRDGGDEGEQQADRRVEEERRHARLQALWAATHHTVASVHCNTSDNTQHKVQTHSGTYNIQLSICPSFSLHVCIINK